MAMSLASTPQTAARFHSDAACSKSSVTWRRRVWASVRAWRHWKANGGNGGRLQCKAERSYKVEIEHEGQKHMLEVPDGETILSVALEAGISVPYDCQLGVCMTCPAKLEKGSVDQDQGMLSDDVKEKGYTLMCVAYPQSDCSIRSIPEEELLSLQLATADD